MRLVTRTLGLTAEGQTSLAPGDAHPSALDPMISALVADLLAGLQREAARAGIAIHDAEPRTWRPSSTTRWSPWA